PLGASLLGQITPQRADMDKLAAAGGGARHRATPDMLAGAAAGHHAVLQRHATEGEHDLGVRDDLLPGYVALGQLLVVADAMRQDDRGSAGTIGVDGLDVAAHRHVQEAVDLALSEMTAATTRTTDGNTQTPTRTQKH